MDMRRSTIDVPVFSSLYLTGLCYTVVAHTSLYTISRSNAFTSLLIKYRGCLDANCGPNTSYESPAYICISTENDWNQTESEYAEICMVCNQNFFFWHLPFNYLSSARKNSKEKEVPGPGTEKIDENFYLIRVQNFHVSKYGFQSKDSIWTMLFDIRIFRSDEIEKIRSPLLVF